jgi:hypothetical protein
VISKFKKRSGSITEASTSTAAKDPVMNATNLVNLLDFAKLLRERQNSPHNQGNFLVGKLTYVHVRERVTLVQSASKYMGQLVEFAELPLGI